PARRRLARARKPGPDPHAVHRHPGHTRHAPAGRSPRSDPGRWGGRAIRGRRWTQRRPGPSAHQSSELSAAAGQGPVADLRLPPQHDAVEPGRAFAESYPHDVSHADGIGGLAMRWSKSTAMVAVASVLVAGLAVTGLRIATARQAEAAAAVVELHAVHGASFVPALQGKRPLFILTIG